MFFPEFEDPFTEANTSDLDTKLCKLCGKFNAKCDMVCVDDDFVCMNCHDASEDNREDF